jgi:hypothetical protein
MHNPYGQFQGNQSAIELLQLISNSQIFTMANTVYHAAASRGHANHGWLNSYHSFSFANYYDPDRMRFGALRVLNDDTVAAGMGFGTHPHDNMEIISIPLEGDLKHQDNLGNSAVIRQGDIQVMSAGTGIAHSEFNRNQDRPVKFLQIWIVPNKRNVTPRYDQITLNANERHNRLQQILSPQPRQGAVWIHQQACFHLAQMDSGVSLTYRMQQEENGVYFFLLDGAATIGEQALNKRDGFGVWNSGNIQIAANENSELLAMEVPMQFSMP